MKLRRMLAVLFALCLAVGVMALSASAEELKAEELTVGAVQETEHIAARTAYAQTVDAAGAALREGLKQRQAEITVNYQVSADKFDGTSEAAQEILQNIYDTAMKHTGVPDEGDYLRWHVGGVATGATYSTDGDSFYFTIQYSCVYFTTLAQEEAVTEKVAEIKALLSLDGSLSDYRKIANIYNYICNTCMDYDYGLQGI